MTIPIRKMRDADIQQVQRIARTTWNATYEGIIPLVVQNNFLDSHYSDESMKLRMERSVLYVAEFEGKIAGFANFSPVRVGGKVELAAIYVDPECQGKGIGTALLQQAINELPGIQEIYVNVEKENKIGINFYKAKGFEIVKEFEEQFDGHSLKQIRMVKHVPSLN